MKISIYDVQDKPLGQGGMGKVYLGSDNKGNLVAIKEMLAEYVTDSDLRARFHQEVKISSQMEHSSIVKMYASFEENANLYLVMEYVEGETIEQYVRQRGALEEVEAIRLICETLSALGYAHQKGFVHRDIKPNNIMIRPNGSVCLLDFGIAKDMNSNGLTIGQVTIGTDGYMSPEQAGGYNIDHRSDIYSLGCVFFYMLTGHHAIEKKLNDHETRIAIIENDFPQAVNYNRNVSVNTQGILNKATYKNMMQRFQSCREFELELKGKRTMVEDNNTDNKNSIISIGRGDCDIIVAHPKVSQHHADIKIETQSGYTKYFFQDRSTNGTVIDGKNIHNSKIEIHPHSHPAILLAGTAELKWNMVEETFRKKRNLVNSGDENIKFCLHCGAAINKDAAICVQCGCAVSDTKEQKIKTQEAKTNSGRKKTAVFVLNLIGLNWISRFITGHIGTGILVLFLYIMISFVTLEKFINGWIGILIYCIIWIVDLITVCTNKWRTGDGKILTKW
jgi:serine/threonine-protein kinase